MRYRMTGVILFTGLFASCGDDVGTPNVDLSGVTVQMRIEPGCECCGRWAQYLENGGARVEILEDQEIENFKLVVGVPEAAVSCHTAMVDGYVIEGHAPARALTKLLSERPTAVGIAVPGMPAKAPGMGGDAQDWRSLDVQLISQDGDLSAYAWAE